jgi:ABC-type sugar transport system substrate-binding protein
MAEAKRVLASLLTQEQEFQRLQAEDARRTAGRAGLALDVVFAESNAVLQIQQLYAALHAPPERRPVAIVVETVAGEGMERVARKAAATGIGWVLINRTVPYLDELRRQHPRLALASVGTDQLEVGKIQGAQVKMLGSQGSVLCVTGPRDTSVAQERLSGLQQAVKASGLEVKVLEGRWTEASGAEALRRWLRLESSQATLLTAIVCQNDEMAVGVWRCLRDHPGAEALRRVPVIGCDGLESGGRRLVNEGILIGTVITPSNAGPAIELVDRWLRSGVAPAASVRLVPTAYPSMEDFAVRAREARLPA